MWRTRRRRLRGLIGTLRCGRQQYEGLMCGRKIGRVSMPNMRRNGWDILLAVLLRAQQIGVFTLSRMGGIYLYGILL